ncbi:hypothetical protein C0995_009026 [Termitomyces sp. Mi166|nr:hypothetical protein C0995_009026 [Termitomyces sp. Mi166\
MDPQKLSGGNSSPGRGSARHDSTPSSSGPIQPNFTSQPSLPSIRQLHPYLPPSGLSQHLSGLGEGSSLIYSQFAPQPSPSGQSLLGSRKSPEIYAMDSDPDVPEQLREPPKKKRRRQALSCTGPSLVLLVHAEESSRNASGMSLNPCGSILNSTFDALTYSQRILHFHREKYVTRTEFEDLKARYDELFEQVQRLQAATQVPPYYQMGIPPGFPGAVEEAVQPTGLLGYRPMISPLQSFNSSTQSQGPQRFIKPEDTQTQSRHHQITTPTSPALIRSPSSTRPPPSDKPPTSAVAKTSPYSLASITSPFHPNSQSKNSYAQTLVLGKRLRPEPQDLCVPAVRFSGMTPHQIYLKQIRRARCNHHLEGFQQVHYHETMTGSHQLTLHATADLVSPNMPLTLGQMPGHLGMVSDKIPLPS